MARAKKESMRKVKKQLREMHEQVTTPPQSSLHMFPTERKRSNINELKTHMDLKGMQEFVKNSPEEQAKFERQAQRLVQMEKMSVMREMREMGGGWLSEHNARQRDQATIRRNNMLSNRMMLACIMPLAQGVSAQSLMQVAGTYVVGCLFVPDFRRQVMEKRNSLMKTVYELKGKRYEPGIDPEIDAHLAKANHGRVPFTAETAAVQYVGMLQEAHDLMREPCPKGVDPAARNQKIMKEFEESRKVLYDLCAVDGVSQKAVNRATLTFLGQCHRFAKEEGDYGFDIGFMTNEIGYRQIREGADAHGTVFAGIDIHGNVVNRDADMFVGNYVLTSDGTAYSDGVTPRVPIGKSDFVEMLNGHMDDMITVMSNVHTGKQGQVDTFYKIWQAFDRGMRDGVNLNEEHMSEFVGKGANKYIDRFYKDCNRYGRIARADGLADTVAVAGHMHNGRTVNTQRAVRTPVPEAAYAFMSVADAWMGGEGDILAETMRQHPDFLVWAHDNMPGNGEFEKEYGDIWKQYTRTCQADGLASNVETQSEPSVDDEFGV